MPGSFAPAPVPPVAPVVPSPGSSQSQSPSQTPGQEGAQKQGEFESADWGTALPSHANPGHFDELRGTTNFVAKGDGFTSAWSQFVQSSGVGSRNQLNALSANLERQIRDNGVTYNVYADADGPQRPWSLDLFPLIVTPQDWRAIEVGVNQRVRLLERVMQDVYGDQQLLARGLLPGALVLGHPGYLRSMRRALPVSGTHLHIAAFDLARGSDGAWCVVGHRTQAPSGLGYLLENRLAISRSFGQAFQTLRVQRLAGTYRALMDAMRRMSPNGANAHIALLTPGPYNETYFEHAYLARYLGLTLVEGNDLTVRDERLFLKTLKGLRPIDALLKRVDDVFLDPLELRADSTLGVPGLLQAVRAGHVLMANAPGSAFLESPALLGFLPHLSEHLLGEKLALPSLPTWWCGERAAMQEALPNLRQCAIKSTYPGSSVHGSFDAVMGATLSASETQDWAARISEQGDQHTLQAYVPLSQMPTWRMDRREMQFVHRSLMLRVFAVCDGPGSWRVLPGGLTRVAGTSAYIAAMQRGGSSADTWVQTDGAVDNTTLLAGQITPEVLTHRKRVITSRAAENLYWLGRYTERAENSIRLARITLEALSGTDATSPALLTWLGQMALTNSLVLPAVPSAAQAPRIFERAVAANIGKGEGAASVGYNLRALKSAASSVRERLSQEHWSTIVRAERDLFEACAKQSASGEYSPIESLGILKLANDALAAITGAQTDRMTRDDGWRLLSIGRQTERLAFLARSLRAGLQTRSLFEDNGFEAMIALFDSTITFHATFQQSRDLAALVDLVVQDGDNPRSLAWVTRTLRGRLAKLADCAPGEQGALSLALPDPSQWQLASLCEPDATGELVALGQLLDDCTLAAFDLSEQISTVYFTHSNEPNRSMSV